MSFRLNQRVAFILLATAFLSITSRAHAADMFWSNTRGDGSGTFSTASHWSGGDASNPPPPDADDIAHFGMTTGGPLPEIKTYTVSFTADATNRAIVVEDDRVTFNLNGNTYTTTDFLDNKIGTVSGQLGRLTITDGAWDFGPGVHDHVDIGAVAGASGALTVSTGGQITGSSVITIGAAGPGTLTVQNGGSIEAFEIRVGQGDPGTLNINSGGSVHLDLLNSGFITRIGGGAGSDGTVNVDGANSTWTILGDLQVAGSGAGSAGALNITAGGLVQSATGIVEKGGTATISGANSRWISSGDLEIGLNTLGGMTVQLVDGGQVQAVNIVVRSGSLRGVGTITGNVIHGGLIAPGNSVGELDIIGNYTQQTSGKLALEIASPSEFDRLDVFGAAALAGTLELSLIEGFAAGASDTFTVLSASGGITGAFGNIASGQRLATSDGLGSFRVNYGSGSPFSPSQVVLSAFQSSIVGDFDVDGDVDGRDFLVWQRGESPNPLSSGDLALWQANFGAPSVAAGVAIPEPNAAWLAAAVVLFGPLLRAPMLTAPAHRRFRLLRPY